MIGHSGSTKQNEEIRNGIDSTDIIYLLTKRMSRQLTFWRGSYFGSLVLCFMFQSSHKSLNRNSYKNSKSHLL